MRKDDAKATKPVAANPWLGGAVLALVFAVSAVVAWLSWRWREHLVPLLARVGQPLAPLWGLVVRAWAPLARVFLLLRRLLTKLVAIVLPASSWPSRNRRDTDDALASGGTTAERPREQNAEINKRLESAEKPDPVLPTKPAVKTPPRTDDVLDFDLDEFAAAPASKHGGKPPTAT